MAASERDITSKPGRIEREVGHARRLKPRVHRGFAAVIERRDDLAVQADVPFGVGVVGVDVGDGAGLRACRNDGRDGSRSDDPAVGRDPANGGGRGWRNDGGRGSLLDLGRRLRDRPGSWRGTGAPSAYKGKRRAENEGGENNAVIHKEKVND